MSIVFLSSQFLISFDENDIGLQDGLCEPGIKKTNTTIIRHTHKSVTVTSVAPEQILTTDFVVSPEVGRLTHYIHVALLFFGVFLAFDREQ